MELYVVKDGKQEKVRCICNNTDLIERDGKYICIVCGKEVKINEGDTT